MPHSPHARSEERQRLQALFNDGSSVLMLAPRRIGKTWLLEKTEEDMSAAGWLCIRIDVEGLRTEKEFLSLLCREIEGRQEVSNRLLNHLKQRFKQISSDIGKDGLVSALGQINPRDFLETLVSSLQAEDKNVLILIDEIALFVLELARTDIDGVRTLLYHLRRLQQQYTRVRWFLTGSIGLDVVARRHNISGAMLGYDTLSLEPFSQVAARSYIHEIIQTSQSIQPYDFAPGAFEHLTRELGWLSPYYLRQVALLIRPTATEPGRRLASKEDVEKAFDKLLSPQARLHFSGFQEHISKNFDKSEADRLEAILDILCDHADGEREETLLTRLSSSASGLSQRQLKDCLTTLSNDGYVHRKEERWRFQSGLLRRYWQEYMQQ